MDHHNHCHSEDQLWGAVEIIPQRLYYAPLKFFPPEHHEEEEEDQSSSDHDGNKQQSAAPNKKETKKKKKPIHYFSIDNELIYWNFFLDFGPLNLGQLYRFSAKLNAKLSSPQYKDCIICYYSGAKGEARANATYLICAWSMLYLGRSLEESYFGFREEFALSTQQQGQQQKQQKRRQQQLLGNASSPPQLRLRRSLSNGSSSSSGGSGGSSGGSSRQQNEPSPFARIHPLPPFHDASPIICTYDLSVYDCLQGLDKARQLGFFKFGNAPPMASTTTGSSSTTSNTKNTKPPRNPSIFNVDEYEYFEQVENGDLNWIVQNKILAFAGPQATKVITPEGFCMLTPADYIPYFLKQNVKLVVRLNKRCYDERDFTKVGIHHVQHYYLDGSCPPLQILHAVVADMESIEDNQAMAMHCKAGLGRTGTCIGAYLMKHYRLTAREVIGWMRICRPGMVIGPQQHFLADIEGLMWQEGETFRGTGLRKMSIGSQEDDVKPAAEAVEVVATVSPTSIMTTPQTKDKHHTSTATAAAATTSASGSPGAHVSIVTPDGKPLHLPTTPVVARKLDINMDATMMDLPTTTLSKPSSSSSLPTNMNALEVNNITSTETTMMQEGDQANALLSRRLDQYQA
ncbi:hypothetical protein ACHAXR_003502, partial [Thalassiosira sp. AJA248-18]